MLEQIVAYLNNLNQEYALGDADYNWSGYHDNCSHTLHNALAAAGVWPHQSVRKTKFLQLFNLSVPANEFANLAFLSNTYPIDDFDRIYREKIKRETLLEKDWLPTRHGALMKLIGVHQSNELYDTRLRIFVLEPPLLKPKSRRAAAMFGEDRYTQIKANLLYYKRRYEAILKKRPEGSDKQEPWWSSSMKARKKYYEYIETQLQDVNNKLNRLASIP
jgi:hypothetical protein